MISFLTINVVYHKGVISGEFLTEIKAINQEQEKIIDDFLITKNESNLNYYLKVKNWQLLTVKNNEIMNIEVLNGIIDPNGQNRLKSSISNSYSDNSRISIFSRNLKIGRNETPFLAFSILENKNGFIVVDGTYFKFLFVHTDLILSSMLLAGTAFWIFLIMFIIFYHEKFLNKKRTKI